MAKIETIVDAVMETSQNRLTEGGIDVYSCDR